jgi:uncharacterized membrane-anchored protein YjiN (DUF445 family)
VAGPRDSKLLGARSSLAINARRQDNAAHPMLMMRITRPRIGQFISARMKKWKNEDLVKKLETNIGSDLQYIRLNGTLVGGMVGTALHAVHGVTVLTRMFHWI